MRPEDIVTYKLHLLDQKIGEMQLTIARLEQELADEKRRRRVLSARFDSREMAS